jgi:hypothetical protein
MNGVVGEWSDLTHIVMVPIPDKHGNHVEQVVWLSHSPPLPLCILF